MDIDDIGQELSSISNSILNPYLRAYTANDCECNEDDYTARYWCWKVMKWCPVASQDLILGGLSKYSKKYTY